MLASYLDKGGKLFISGQDIGWDLCDKWAGSSNEYNTGYTNEAIQFHQSYLHARYLTHVADFSSQAGKPGDPIGDGLNFRLRQPGRRYLVQHQSQIEPLNNAVSIFDYPDGKSGGIRFSGDHKVVYLGYGFEAIRDIETRHEVMYRIVNWLNGFSIEHIPPKDTEDTTKAAFI
ncbi:hypothetical protein BVY01_05120 [bacterium I07]|nr:hypothetical protein BVY01_05120 [bacterium I07]